ncbi:hypothetical protein KFE25_000725 [Diacronema lutheri]|uniref:Glutamate--cysteine ligase n=1 Tax=Diacronema lutheri TaxID=2081491 RepID=A0A8J6CCC2_DIALT|nr:hypothetical protein KFE25_000725 [Diacronema lutheri]
MAPLHLVGEPMSWAESKPHLREIRRRGVAQFIALYRSVEHAVGRELLWGDEIEYHLMRLDGEPADAARTVKLSLRAPELLDKLVESEGTDPSRYDGCAWHAEYGRWMVEATPREPFGSYATEMLRVERSMRLRRQRLLSMLEPNEIIPTVPTFPLMGVGDFAHPPAPTMGPVARSESVPDDVINPHPRMRTLTANIRERRGDGTVEVRVPLFRDICTPEFKSPPPPPYEAPPTARADGAPDGAADGAAAAPQPTVRGDAMAYGMGSCCLQVTFQARDVHESRFLTDQLAVLAPIFLALTAATPTFRGRLVDTDVRWAAISQAVDDRTPAERHADGTPVPPGAEQPELAGAGVRRFAKSRYASISHFIYDCPVARLRGERNPILALNDLECEVDEEIAAQLRAAGLDEALTQHIAYNFSRDPLVLFRERIAASDAEQTEHFESLQSTNWNSVRWKPPPAMGSPIGWRTEFRPMEVQLTDFENAAFTNVVMLLTRAILSFDLDLLVPVSRVDENMRRAHARDAVSTQKFYFRKHLVNPAALRAAADGERAPRDEDSPATPGCTQFQRSLDVEEMSLAEVLNGKGDYFPGLLPIVGAYIDSISASASVRAEVHRYMKLIGMRASGLLQTSAQWQRHFITSHADYLSDSVVSPAIARDLMVAAHEVGVGKRPCKEVLGTNKIEPILPVDAWDVKLESSRVDGTTRCQLLRQYMARPAFMTRLKAETHDQSLPDVVDDRKVTRQPCLFTG